MRYILFGDSIGVGVGDYQNGGWATQLKLFIDQDKKSEDHTLINLSISGDTTRGLLDRMEREAKHRIKDKSPENFTVLLAIGTNDSKVNKDDIDSNISQTEFQENLVKLVGVAHKLSHEVVLIGLVPVHEPDTTPFKENKHYTVSRMAEYNQIINQVAIDKGLKMINMFDDWKNGDLQELFADGLHPNTEGHRLMFEKVRDELFTK